MSDESITTIATHSVKAEKREAFLKWLERVRLESAKFDGYIDARLIEPIAGRSDDYASIFRFDTYEHLQAWLSSDAHHAFMEEVAELSYRKVRIAPYKSLEFWFPTTKAPSRLKMSVVTYVGLLPLVIVIPPAVERLMDGHALVLTSVSTAVSVLLMSYAVMPVLNRLLMGRGGRPD